MLLMAGGKFIIGATGKFQIAPSGKFDICETCCGTDRWRPCGNEDDSGDIFLPVIVKDEMGEGETVIKLDGDVPCYFWVEPATGTPTEYETVDYYSDCDAYQCDADCPCGPCATVIDGENSATLQPGENGPCVDGYTELYQTIGITAGRIIYSEFLSRWIMEDVAGDGWSASLYLGPSGDCPDGEFTLETTTAGAPPDTLIVVTSECCIDDCADECVSIDDGTDDHVLGWGMFCAFSEYISGPVNFLSTEVFQSLGNRRWYIRNLANDGAGWSGDYSGNIGDCPSGEFTLIAGTDFGSPPATVTVTAGACP
jgi:hypothetical protein